MSQAIAPGVSAPGQRAEQLQFLRFLAFLNIFISHAEVWNFFGYPATRSASFAVSFFFCLSGLVTGYSGFGKEIRLTVPEMARYMGKKIRKVYPLYVLTMLFPLLYSAIPELIAGQNWEALAMELRQLGRNLLLIQSWFTEGYFSINGVGWFLSSLMFLNLLNLPALYLLNRVWQKRKGGILLGLGAAGILLLTVLYCGLTRYQERSYWHYIFPPARAGEYLLGMMLGFVLRPAGEKLQTTPKNRRLFTLWELAGLMLWAAYLYGKGFYWLEKSVHWIAPNLLLLAAFALGKGWISRLFRWKPLVYLGDISFECFLIHQPFLVRYEILHGSQGLTVLDQAVAFFFCLGITLVLAWVLHRGTK